MGQSTLDNEEHELPGIEAVLAGTLALMTGFSQALQAELHPQQRLSMSAKIGTNLALLIDHPQLSLGFRQVLLGLRNRWLAMRDCTAQAARDCDCDRDGACDATEPLPPPTHDTLARFHVAAPKRLQ
jgi:hypothetical protein